MKRTILHGLFVAFWAVVGGIGYVACGESPSTSQEFSPGFDANVFDFNPQVDTAPPQQDAPLKETPPKDKAPKVDLLAPGMVLQIDIKMAPADWDAVRKQHRNYDNFLTPHCGNKPFESPFEYKKATVTINGTTFQEVGVRKKGFVGSIDENKPSLKIKLDEYVDGQEIFGVDLFTLNNNRQDPSLVRQCLAYYVFAKAGVPAPRCNFAFVKVNGVDLGVYAHVENVRKDFLQNHFSNKDGKLYEGTLSDFREGWVGSFEPKLNDQAPETTEIDALVAALKLPDSDLLPALAKILNIDRFIKFWAAEVLLNHWDGYSGNTNNFYVYYNPDTKLLEFLPWGPDATFTNSSKAPTGAPDWVFAKGLLVRRLYQIPETQAKYVNQLRALLTTAWKEQELQTELERMAALLAPIATKDIFLQKRGGVLAPHIDDVLSFIRNRRNQLKSVLDNPPAWNVPLAEKICFDPIGEGKGTFSTKFSALPIKDPFATGTGTITATFNGQPFTPLKIGATATPTENAPGFTTINVIAQRDSTKFLVAAFVLETSVIAPNATLPLYGFLDRGKSVLAEFDGQTQKAKLLGLLWSGTISFEQADLTLGQPVVGSFSATWVTQSK